MTYCYTGQAGGRSSNSNSSDSFGGGDAGTMVQAQLATRVFLDSRDAGRTPTIYLRLLYDPTTSSSQPALAVSMHRPTTNTPSLLLVWLLLGLVGPNDRATRRVSSVECG